MSPGRANHFRLSKKGVQVAFVVLSNGKRSKMFGQLSLFRLQKTSCHQCDFRDLCDQLLHTLDKIVLMRVFGGCYS